MAIYNENYVKLFIKELKKMVVGNNRDYLGLFIFVIML